MSGSHHRHNNYRYRQRDEEYMGEREPPGGGPNRPRSGPLKSVEGWVVFVTGIHDEAQEDDLTDAFSEHGTVTKVQINMDRQTGFAKGYALVEYATQSQAQDAINKMHGAELLGKKIGVHWAFVKPTGHGVESSSVRPRPEVDL